jgi:DNA-binding response OmpR family regulator
MSHDPFDGSAKAEGPPRRLNLLIVEDHADSADMLALLLGNSGHAVGVARSLAQARAALAAGPVDVVVCDILLPDGSGLDLMREWRGRGVCGVAVSGLAATDDVRRSLDAGFAAHLAKPLDVRRLGRVIAEVAAGPECRVA